MHGTAFVRSTNNSEKRSIPAKGVSIAKMKVIGRVAAKMMAGVFVAFLAVTSAAAANPATPYPRMAPVDAYLMERTQEIALARSAAPTSVSQDATVLVLTRTGYETAVTGTNGFVCMVGRGFSGAFDWPERWNPRIRAAECLNPAAARSVMPFAKLRTAMILAGRTTDEIIDQIKVALTTHEIPPLEPRAMSYMMSRLSYLTDESHRNMPHLMFFVPVENATDWGANAHDTPVIGGNYWFLAPGHEAESGNLPPLSVFLVGVGAWSDGVAAPPHPISSRGEGMRE